MRETASLQFRTSCITWSRGARLTSSPFIWRIWSPGINLLTLGPPLVTNLEHNILIVRQIIQCQIYLLRILLEKYFMFIPIYNYVYIPLTSFILHITTNHCKTTVIWDRSLSGLFLLSPVTKPNYGNKKFRHSIKSGEKHVYSFWLILFVILKGKVSPITCSNYMAYFFQQNLFLCT